MPGSERGLRTDEAPCRGRGLAGQQRQRFGASAQLKRRRFGCARETESGHSQQACPKSGQDDPPAEFLTGRHELAMMKKD
ncbi:hypothetical protein BRAS3843_1990006 [Bradyrhizobium sp. STM 3843]|nr:hypothetical protein BRAS3843_1990006 [Bradyrhizobium sp. STM 3843]